MGLWLLASLPALILVLSFIRFSFVFGRLTLGGMTSPRGIGACPVGVNERSCCGSDLAVRP